MVKLPKIIWPKLIGSILFCQLSGILGAFFTISAIPTWYADLTKPFFNPPNWLFGPVWTILYTLMGISLYLIWVKPIKLQLKKPAIRVFLLQLGLNFLWTPIFFGVQSPEWALINIILMWLSIVATIIRFYSLNAVAAALLIPYLLWVSFASFLNASIVVLN